MVGTTGANATGGGGGIWRKLVMFEFFLCRIGCATAGVDVEYPKLYTNTRGRAIVKF